MFLLLLMTHLYLQGGLQTSLLLLTAAQPGHDGSV